MQFTQEGDRLEFMNAFEIPARDAVPMEVMSVLIFCTFIKTPVVARDDIDLFSLQPLSHNLLAAHNCKQG